MTTPSNELLAHIRKGCVIPASPLALTPERKFDSAAQQTLMRYYLESGAGGVAVGMHFTQFEIRNPGINLYEPVLRTCAEAIDEWQKINDRPIAKIAGINGRTDTAIEQAKVARELGYDFVIPSLSTFDGDMDEDMLYHMKKIAEIMPVFGFYLLTGVGGIHLSYRFWRELVEMDNLYGIKIAPFNRYFTLDVCRAIAEAGKHDEIALYTGNDDSILYDLLTPHVFDVNGEQRAVRIVGGLLGQWACWTHKAVQLLDEAHAIASGKQPLTTDILTKSMQITDANAALFDPAHGFNGSIPGVNEILRRRGLMKTHITLKPDEVLSPGQLADIDRVCVAYPHLQDDDFINANIASWQHTEALV